MSTPNGFSAATLLQALTESQCRLVDVIATGFLESSWQWPIFDYVEAELEADGMDVWSELERLPRDPSNGYAAAWWPNRGAAKPQADEKIGLTVLGWHFVENRRQQPIGFVPLFFALLNFLAAWRRQQPSSPSEPRNLTVSSEEVVSALLDRGMSPRIVASDLLLEMLEHEPAIRGGGGQSGPDGWTRSVPRMVYDFQGVQTIEAYIEQMLVVFPAPAPQREWAVPSPLSLVASIDYLDTVWRLVPGHKSHLFRLRSAERVARLAFGAQTADEFDSRLSALGEVLRDLQLPDHVPVVRPNRDKPLARFEAYLKQLRPESEVRIERAIETLHDVLAIRDAGQHTAAGRKGAAALTNVGVGYPPSSWSYGWSMISARTVEALDALREELTTLAP